MRARQRLRDRLDLGEQPRPDRHEGLGLLNGPSDEVARFDWIGGSGLDMAACVTFIEATDALRAAWAFGGDLDECRTLRLDEIDDEFEDNATVALRRLDGWILAIELNGFQGSRAEVMRPLTKGARALSVYWSVNSSARITYAVDGQVLDPDGLDEQRAGLWWDNEYNERWEYIMLVVAARVTGIWLDPGHLDGSFLVAPINPR